MGSIVEIATKAMNDRRQMRAAAEILPGSDVQEELESLRAGAFTRRNPGEAFHPLNQRELAILEDAVSDYVAKEQLHVAVTDDDHLMKQFDVIRHNHLAREKTVQPSEFRAASDKIVARLLRFVQEKYGVAEDVVMMLPWRAALAFAEPAWEFGITNFYHFGARRDEATLETEIYFEEVPEALKGDPADNKDREAIIADPMLATGNTIIAAIKRLLALGIREENITVVSVISAPEGVDHILSQFPDVMIVAGNHDECLNDKGYIVHGLGDFGDLWCESLSISWAKALLDKGIFSEISYGALAERMAA